MNRLLPLTAAFLLAIGWTPAARAARLGRDVIPTFQAVELQVDADRTGYGGSVRIALRILKATHHFDLHAEDLTLTSVALEGPAVEVDAQRAFFSRPENQVAGTERYLGRVAAEVNECLALRAREGQSVRAFLETGKS